MKISEQVFMEIMSKGSKPLEEKNSSLSMPMFIPLSNPNRTHNFKLEKTFCKYLDSFPKVTLPKTWNNFRLDLKSSKSVNSFKRNFQSDASFEYSTFNCQNSTCYSCIN